MAVNFHKGQRIVCIAKKNEWDSVTYDFDEQLKIALGSRKIPKPGQTVVVANPFELLHKGRVYISLADFPDNIFDQSGFAAENFESMINTSSVKFKNLNHG